MDNDLDLTAPTDDPVLVRPRTRRRRRLIGALAGVGVLLLVGVVGVVVVQHQRDEERPVGPAPVPGRYPFGDSSVWRQDVSGAPLNPRSGALVANLAAQVRDNYGGIAAFNVDNFSTSFYTVGPDQPTVDVAFDDCQDKGYVPGGLTGEDGQFTAVPVPADAVPAKGTDKQLTVYQPSTDRLWEFWQASKVDGRWQACWGGRLDHASTSPGYFPGGFGSSASGLAISGGMVRVDDVEAGRIDHALALQIISPRSYQEFSWPAQRSDGWSDDPDAVPEGLRLRLDPSVDVASLGLEPVTEMIALAAQKYGFIVVDKAGAVAVTGETGTATQGTNPWPGFLRGVPDHSVLKGFPWQDLQALPVDYGRP